MEKKLFKVVITAIVVKSGFLGGDQGKQFLVLQRGANEKKFPNRWIVPGGKLTTEDYIHGQKETPHYWYDVLEKALRREVKEEAGIEIENIRYVTSLADYEEDKDPSVVISCLVDHASGEVVIQKEEMQGFKWVRLQEAQSLDLIEGIYEELVMADRVLNGEKVGEWTQ